MPVFPINTIKSWFDTVGEKPGPSKFLGWIDSFWHKNETIPISSVDGLQSQLNNIPVPRTLALIEPSTVGVSGIASLTIGEGILVEKVIGIAGASTTNFGVGTSAGVNNIFSTELAANTHRVIEINRYFVNQGEIYFAGNNLTVKVYQK